MVRADVVADPASARAELAEREDQAATAAPKPMRSASPTSTAAASAATDPTLRSKAPVISTTVIATPMMPTSDAW